MAILWDVADDKGPLALVTGASSGIGEAYAERLAADGWDLIVVGRRQERLEQLAVRLNSSRQVEVEVVAADLAVEEGLERVASLCANRELQLLVNNAGLAHYMAFENLPLAKLDELLWVNVRAVTHLARIALDGMLRRGRGSIINVASLLAFSDAAEGPFLPQRAIYAASKAFVAMFSRRLAAEVADRGIRVQVVCPGVVRSEFHVRQGMDLSGVPRMDPAAVVQASMEALASGEVVCIPTLTDPNMLEARDRAQGDLLSAVTSAALAGRYKPE